MAIIGYARTSTREQEAGLQAQIRDLIAAGSIDAKAAHCAYTADPCNKAAQSAI